MAAAVMQISDGAINLLARLLEARTGQMLAVDRRWRIEMALTRLMRERAIASPDALVGQLFAASDNELINATVDALLNNETFFYRDFAAFELLADRALARIERLRERERRLRIWSAGCSTGQEAYTLAMIFADRPERWRSWRIEIVATDVSHLAIQRARDGIYTQFEVQRGLTVRSLMKWFTPEGDRWRAAPTLRNAVNFTRRNLLEAPPEGDRFDIILCRNVLLYFSPKVRRAAFARLAEALLPEGVLMLGAGETAIGQTDAFVSDYEARGLYRPIVGTPAPLMPGRQASSRRG